MTRKPFHIAAVLIHLDAPGTGAAGTGRISLPDARRIIARVKAKGLRVGVAGRGGSKALRDLIEQGLRIHPAELSPRVRLEEPGAGGRRGGTRNPFRAAARRLGCPPQRLLVVSADPEVIRLARAGGAVTAAWRPAAAPAASGSFADFQVGGTAHLDRVVRMGLPLPAGKLPNDLLKEFLGEFAFDDPALLIRPGVGEDIAAVDVSPEEVLVLKSDPITFATDAIGRYAVLVNANDIATAGAVPRWLLTTLLFPVGTTPSFMWSVIGELRESCRQWGITLCGGHTEITDAVRRPVVCGTMAGSVRRRDLIDKREMRPGDRVLLTKGAAVEGTAIIARELGARLRRLGLSAEQIRSGRSFLERISIIPEARLAARCPGTSAMHDVTEGGIATALEELGAAGGCRLRVDLDRIPVFPETRALCRLLDLNPLGLIGSGSLLICCRPAHAGRLEADLMRAGIQVARIGEVAGKGAGVQGFKRGRPARWPRFAVDEIARLFQRGKKRRRNAP
jgi:hydrogenase maturation factor